MKLKQKYYTDRKGRQHFLAANFGKYLQGSVLDVGCSDNHLKNILKGQRILGVDINKNADVVLNLEKQKLPFKKGEFDTVICLEVLEHLNNFYEVFEDLLKIAKKYVIISLPNNYDIYTISSIFRGKPMKQYGLPPTPPEDRHKWLFSLKEAIRFLKVNQRKYNYKIKEQLIHFNFKITIKNFWKVPFYYFIKLFRKNLVATNIWFVLEK